MNHLGIIAIAIAIILSLSILANAALLYKLMRIRKAYTEDMDDDHELPSINRQKMEPDEDQVIKFIDEQLKETKGYLKEENLNGKDINTKVIALRTAYLNVEKSAYHKLHNNILYWKILNDRLLKILSVFLPKLFGSESKLTELENRTSLLRERVRLMNINKNTESNAERSTNALIKEIKQRVGEQDSMEEYLAKLERMVEAFENPSVRKFYKNVFEAEHYSQKSLHSFDKLYKNIDQNLSSIDKLEKQLLHSKNSDQNEENKGEEAKKQRLIEQELERYKGDNERLRSHLDTLKSKILEYEGRVKEKSTSVKVSILEGNGFEDIESDSDEIKRLGEEITDIEEKEIERLRDLITRQRKSITSLDTAIDDLREELKQEKESSKEKNEEISILNRNLKESGMCIETLEQQMQELQNSLGKQQDEEIFTEDDLQELNKEVNRLREELKNSNYDRDTDAEIINYIEDALQAGSIEDMATLLYDQITRNESVPSIEVKYQSKKIVVSQSGKISPSDKIIFENMQLFEMNIDASGRSLKFNLPHIAGVLRATDKINTFRKNEKKLSSILKLSNLIIAKVGAQQSISSLMKDTEMYQNSIKKIAFEIDKGMTNQAKRSKDVIESCVGQIQDIAISSGLDKSKIKAFEDIKKDAFYRINSDEAFRLKARKQFLGLLKLIEKK